MKNGLAIWHYPHRSVLENVRFFAEQGFDSVSILGFHMDQICADQTQSEELARLITEKGLTLTVHHKLPRDHSEENVSRFQASVDRFAAWQRKYNCLVDPPVGCQLSVIYLSVYRCGYVGYL